MKIWIVTITDRHGTEHWACASEQIVQAHLADYVRENWHKEFPDEPMPEDSDEAIDYFFENTEESCEIDWAMLLDTGPHGEQSCALCRNLIPQGDKLIQSGDDVFCSEECLKEAKGQ